MHMAKLQVINALNFILVFRRHYPKIVRRFCVFKCSEPNEYTAECKINIRMGQ